MLWKQPGTIPRRLGLALVVAIGLAACNPAAEISAPVVVLDNIEVRGFSGGAADLSLVLDIDNQNRFEVILIELSGALVLDEIPVGEAQWLGEIKCPKLDTTTARIPIHLVVGDQGDAFRDLIDRQPMIQAFDGEATIARGVITRTYAVHLRRPSGREGR